MQFMGKEDVEEKHVKRTQKDYTLDFKLRVVRELETSHIYGAYNEAVFSMVGENGRKALRTKWFRHVRENGLNISKRFFSLHGLTSALRLRGFSADLRAIALHRACRWG